MKNKLLIGAAIAAIVVGMVLYKVNFERKAEESKKKPSGRSAAKAAPN